MLSLITSMIAGIGRRHLALWRDTGGVVAIVMAIFLPVLVGIAALVIDMGYAYWTRTQLQHAASAAALAGAGVLLDADENDEPDTNAYRDMAIRYAFKNMKQVKHGAIINTSCGVYDAAGDTIGSGKLCNDVEVGYWLPSPELDFKARYLRDGSFNPNYDPLTMELNAVKVVTRNANVNGNALKLFLGASVGLAQTDIGTSAVAVLDAGDTKDWCMIALDPSAPQSLYIQGTAEIASDGCGICVNSTDPDEALYLNGTPIVYVDAGEIVVGGGYSTVGNVDLYPTPTTNAGANACTDPFAGVVPQAFADRFDDDTCPIGASPVKYKGNDFPVSIAPGLHCGGIEFQGNGYVEFEPGIHHIKNGTLLERGSHTYFGEGVTFLIDNATIDLAGSQKSELFAGATLSDGSVSEFLIYENPNGPHPAGQHHFRGNAGGDYGGIIYVPDRDTKWVGTSSAVTGVPPDCFAVIANQFYFTGTSYIGLTAEGCGGLLETVSNMTLRLVD